MASQTNKKNAKPNHSGPTENQSNQLKEIQNLLFGEQLNHVEEEINAFRQEIEARLSSLEKKLQSSIEEKSDVFDKALAEHAQSLQKLQTTQMNDNTSVESALEKVNELLKSHSSDHSKAHKALQKDLEKETEKIKKTMAQQNTDIQERVDQSVQLLSQNKTDRKELASLFQSVVKSLEA
jgi:ABC-type transporter Mla subunit MlaD